jgi:M6 family metalloprotease-like protein
MKRALCLAGTFFATTAALRGFPSAAAEFEESRMAENDAAVVPVPSTEQRLHQPSPHNRNLFHQSSPSSSSNNRHLANGSNSTFRNLVLLLRFSDHSSRSLPSQSDVSELYNSVLPTTSGANADIAPTGSVRQVFLENSYGQFTIETTVTDWITLPHTEAYYAAGNHGFTMLKEGIIYALNYLENDPFFSYSIFDVDDDGNIDGLGVLTSGFGAEFAGIDCYGSENNYRIWSHKGSGLNWSSQERHNSDPINVNRYYVSSALRGKCGSDIVRMGVICHELGHYLGLPDLYDPSFSGVGIGAYDFMSQSWGFDGSGLYPPFLSAWSKVEVGWAKVVEIIHDGTFDIEASWKSSIVYKLSAGFPEGEYLLIENRQPYSYDEKLPGIGGLAIWHIDDNAKSQDNAGYPDMEETSTGYFPENSYHYQIALLSADGD